MHAHFYHSTTKLSEVAEKRADIAGAIGSGEQDCTATDALTKDRVGAEWRSPRFDGGSSMPGRPSWRTLPTNSRSSTPALPRHVCRTADPRTVFVDGSATRAGRIC